MHDFSRCHECGDVFDNVFDYVEHFMEGEDFDPSLILPGGFSLKVGSMLRDIYFSSLKKDYTHIKELVQSAYHVLFIAEMDEGEMKDFFEEREVERAMLNFDKEIRNILNESPEDRG